MKKIRIAPLASLGDAPCDVAGATYEADPLDAPLIDTYTRRGLLKASDSDEREALIVAAPNALYHPIKCEYNQCAGLDALWWAEHLNSSYEKRGDNH